MLAAIKQWWTVAVGLVYPANCAVCKRPRESDVDSALCASCRGQMRPIPKPFCERCNQPFEGAITGEFQCSNCVDKEYCFDYAVCGCRLTGVARECVHQFKYQRALWVGPELAALMIAAARERIVWENVDMVVPVPLFPSRQRERGFNQAEWLARRLVRALPAPLCKGNLRRIRDTNNQALLNAAERIENVSGAFAVRDPKPFLQRRVVLVDDVFTTGATTNECARVLRSAGAVSVIVLTVGRG